MAPSSDFRARQQGERFGFSTLREIRIRPRLRLYVTANVVPVTRSKVGARRWDDDGSSKAVQDLHPGATARQRRALARSREPRRWSCVLRPEVLGRLVHRNCKIRK